MLSLSDFEWVDFIIGPDKGGVQICDMFMSFYNF